MKGCPVAVAKEICPEYVNAFKSVNLSRNIVAEMGDNFEAQLIARTNTFIC